MTVWPETEGGGKTQLGHRVITQSEIRDLMAVKPTPLALGPGVMVEFYSLLISRSPAPGPGSEGKAGAGARVPSLLNQ